jgi:hypothetical protein
MMRKIYKYRGQQHFGSFYIYVWELPYTTGIYPSVAQIKLPNGDSIFNVNMDIPDDRVFLKKNPIDTWPYFISESQINTIFNVLHETYKRDVIPKVMKLVQTNIEKDKKIKFKEDQLNNSSSQQLKTTPLESYVITSDNIEDNRIKCNNARNGFINEQGKISPPKECLFDRLMNIFNL